MPDIHIDRDHQLGLAKAREVALQRTAGTKTRPPARKAPGTDTRRAGKK